MIDLVLAVCVVGTVVIGLGTDFGIVIGWLVRKTMEKNR
jgi:hypothetical protein